MGISLNRGTFGEPGGELVCQGLADSTSALCTHHVSLYGEPGGRVSLLGTLKTMQCMSRKALEMGHPSL
jgi:hypothetical protein